jgi:hypothetical protein
LGWGSLISHMMTHGELLRLWLMGHFSSQSVVCTRSKPCFEVILYFSDIWHMKYKC